MPLDSAGLSMDHLRAAEASGAPVTVTKASHTVDDEQDEVAAVSVDAHDIEDPIAVEEIDDTEPDGPNSTDIEELEGQGAAEDVADEYEAVDDYDADDDDDDDEDGADESDDSYSDEYADDDDDEEYDDEFDDDYEDDDAELVDEDDDAVEEEEPDYVAMEDDV